MVGFRNKVGSAALTAWVSPSSQQIAFARGTYLTHSLDYQVLTYKEHRRARLCRDQQRGQRMEYDIHDGPARRLVLQRHRRHVRRRSVHWDCVRGQLIRRKKRLTLHRRSFTIGSNGGLVVTVGPRQAVAVHVGQLGTGTGTPQTVQQVPVMFSETATTTYGEVCNSSFPPPSVCCSSCWTPTTEHFRRGKRSAIG
jgi:hypothetical protein